MIDSVKSKKGNLYAMDFLSKQTKLFVDFYKISDLYKV